MGIFITSIKFESNGIVRSEWEKENEDIIVNIKMSSGYPKYLIYEVDLNLLNNLKAVSIWLKKNSDFFEFYESSSFIEKAHFIPLNPTLKNIIDIEIKNNNFVKYSVNELKKELKNKGVVLDRIDYKQYMQFELKNRNLTLDIINDYDITKDCYSFPFFKSILVINNETDFDNCSFTFLNMNINGPTIAILVEFSNKTIKLYDYTHNPPYGVAYSEILKTKNNLAY